MVIVNFIKELNIMKRLLMGVITLCSIMVKCALAYDMNHLTDRPIPINEQKRK